MGLDFPNNPALNQQWIGSNGALYTWDGVVWALTSPVAGTLEWMNVGTALQPIRGASYPVGCGPINLLGSGTTVPPVLSFQNFRPANAPTAQGDTLLSIGYWGYDGSAAQRAGDISVQAAELWGGPGRGCNLYISTTPTGATTRQIRLGFVGQRYTYFDNLTGLRVGDATQIPREMLDVKGATILGPSTNATPVDGTLQYAGGIFQGRVGGTWVNIPGQAVLTGPAGGSLIGTYPNPGIANGAVGTAQLAPGVTGNLLPTWNPATDVGKAPVIQPNGSVAWNFITATGTAGGALTGSYPNPTIAPGAINASMIANGTITDAQIANLSYSKLLGAPAIPTTLPPSGGAGGSLAGAYPNPSIAAGAVGRSQLGVGAALGPITFQPVPANFVLSTTGWTTLVSMAITTRGGWVLMWAAPCLTANGPSGGAMAWSRWLCDGVHIVQQNNTISSSAFVPVPPLNWMHNPAAGGHLYQYQVAIDPGMAMLTNATVGGGFLVVEIG